MKNKIENEVMGCKTEMLGREEKRRRKKKKLSNVAMFATSKIFLTWEFLHVKNFFDM